ncbi:DUF2922 domain-containing protein [Alkalicoccus urumqiensis]|uniref:DUF2922 domain-containing protein n=1 Tax=Alkalicoccus urumqiensis TaxID=1548213 RepID=A0A2P6MDZ8_ALKUR|nr:DUF2922 domain-containing protein [Alkalicoccus urumqiensis]PRO64486.1 DUF2922 domain-containing protein [Alkalicoccus urumqiensis]
MSKRLELQFRTEEGNATSIGVDLPKEPVDAAEVETVMQQLIEAGVFTASGSPITEIRGARLVERNVETIELPTQN